jgi:putative N6-adenine-specific DNA methylase
MRMNLCAPCLFGLEGLLGNELRHLGLDEVKPENGRVRFAGDGSGLARANICSRFAERILIELGSFRAESFDALFEGTKALPWEDFIPQTGRFPVKGFSLDSLLHSVPDCQKIIKKAVAARLGARYGQEWLPESGALYQVQFSLMKDKAVLYLDSSGVSLHKRGYRPAQVAAPLRETLAAAMVDIAGYRGHGDFCDPFCGSGTLAVEAAFAARNRAPGLLRNFSAQDWDCFEKAVWTAEREAARDREFHGDYPIFASDIDPKAVSIARANAERAGEASLIHFEVSDARRFSRRTERGVVVTNPPYGARMLEQQEAEELYRGFGAAMEKLTGWSLFLLSSHAGFERFFGRSAGKRRKLYNGTIPCTLYIYQ